MKILMLNYEYPPIGGGAGNAFRHLLMEYAKRNDLSIDVLTAAPEPNNSIEPFSNTIRIHKIGIHKKNLHYWTKPEVLKWLWNAGAQLKQLLSKNQYDVAHAFFGFPTGWLTYRCRTQLPYIISLRGSDVPGYNVRLKLDYYLLKGLFHKIWQNAAAVIANSKGLAELAKQFEPSLDIGVICNGIDTDTFSPPCDRSLDGRVKLLTVCRLIARKRIHILIDTVHLLKQRDINAELNIVGEGNLLNELKARVRQLNLADRVKFMGLVEYDRIPSVYRQNHLFLMSSEHEGMSNAMLEAMACGLPVVSSACEGTEELVSNNGRIVPIATAEKFAEVISEIVKATDQYTHMAEESRNIAEQFSWASSAQDYIDLYRKIAGTHT